MISQKLITRLNQSTDASINFIDIGCHQGVFINVLRQNINKPIYSIGIDAIDHGVGDTYDIFINNAVDNVDSKRIRKFHLYNETGCNSLLELNKEILTQQQSEYDNKWYVGNRDIDWHYTEQNTIDVTVDSMEHILQSLNYNRTIDFVKIDTQGNDVNVLLSFKSFLPSIRYLQIETVYTHNKNITLYKNQPIFEEDHKILQSLGFEILDILNWGENKDQCPEADIIYYNTKFN